MTLGLWLIKKLDTPAWRAGKVKGWKHPEVDEKMIAEVWRTVKSSQSTVF